MQSRVKNDGSLLLLCNQPYKALGWKDNGAALTGISNRGAEFSSHLKSIVKKIYVKMRNGGFGFLN